MRAWMGLALGIVSACARDPLAAGDTDADTDVALAWGDGPRAVSGHAFFFDMPTFGQVEEQDDVEGGLVYVLEAPEIQAPVSAADGYAFRLEGLPEGADVTVALTQPDHFPSLTATFHLDGADVADVTFQSVSWTLADLLAGVVGQDAHDTTRCQMVTTVTAPNPDGVYAPGEPDATVTIDPPIHPDLGPVYFNTMVLPDRRLTATSTDGGVITAGVGPGDYVWTGHKDGLTFSTLHMKCVAGWLTNASPPWGMNVTSTTGAPAAR